MTAKEYLRFYRWLDIRISNINAAIEREDARLQNISPVLKENPVTTSGGHHASFESSIDKLLDLRMRYKHYVDAYTAINERTVNMIAKMEDDRYREVLSAYYISCKAWERIAVDMNYNYRYVQELHGKALQQFENMYSDYLEPLTKDLMVSAET